MIRGKKAVLESQREKKWDSCKISVEGMLAPDYSD